MKALILLAVISLTPTWQYQLESTFFLLFITDCVRERQEQQSEKPAAPEEPPADEHTEEPFDWDDVEMCSTNPR